MAVLNPDSNNDDMDPDPDPDPAPKQAETSQGSDPTRAISEGNNLLRDANDLLHSVNDLLQNPVVQKKLENRTQQQQQQAQQQQAPNTMMGQQQERAPPPQADNSGPRPQGQGSEKEKEKAEIRPEDLDLLEIFQAKLISEDQREELADGIDQIGALIEDDLDGMDSTLEELKEYITSEELENQIEQLKEAGVY